MKMRSKEALENISHWYNEERDELLTATKEYDIIYDDLEVLDKLKAKTHLLFKYRKAIAKEFDKWCEDNNAMNCSENMATWFLTIKLKEWLENDK